MSTATVTFTESLESLCVEHNGHCKPYGRGFMVYGVPLLALESLEGMQFVNRRMGGVFVAPSTYGRVKSNTGCRTAPQGWESI